MKFTELQAKNAKTDDKPLIISIGNGLLFEVRKTGRKTWRFRYMVDNKPHKMSIGSYPEMSVAAARAEAVKLKALYKDKANPTDPLEARRAAKEEAKKSREREATEAAKLEQQNEAEENALTMDQLFEKYAELVGPTLEKHNRAVIGSWWRCHISPSIGSKKLLEAKKAEVMAHHNQLVKDGKVRTANGSIQLLRRVMKWAEQSGYCDESHPLLKVEKQQVQAEVSTEQMPENFNAEDYLKRHGSGVIGQDAENDKAGRALQFSEIRELLHLKLPNSTQATTGKCLIKFMLATGIRASEAIRIRWAWISIPDRVLFLPSGAMKKQRMHHVYLSDFALAQLEEMQKMKCNDFVFPAEKIENAPIRRDNVAADVSNRQFYGQQHNETEEAFAIRQTKRMRSRRATKEYQDYNLPGGKWTLYDMRRTVATRLEELGFSEALVSKTLAHRNRENNVTARYTRYSYWNERCEALAKIGSALNRCEAGLEITNYMQSIS